MSGHTVTLIRRMRMLTKAFALVTMLYLLSAVAEARKCQGWDWVFSAVGCAAFAALTFECRRRSKALVIEEINRKFGVTNE